MKLAHSLIMLMIVLSLGCWIVQCGDTGSGDATTLYDDDDDDTGDNTGCNDAIAFIYDTCELYFVQNDETVDRDDALVDCLAYADTSDAWICRLNCAGGVDTCDLLLSCLNKCPTS